VLASNLREIASPNASGLKALDEILTPCEIEVADLLRRGCANREMAGLLGVSEPTVAFHRANIRRKLGLKNKKINLRTYLRAQT